jgi:transposase
MDLTMTAAQRAELEAAADAAQRTRAWKRCQAVLLLAEGHPPARVAHALRCHVASVYPWVARWRQAGVAGLAEGPHPGAVRRLDAAGEVLLERLLDEDPQAHGHQATGWTVAWLHGELTRAGYRLGARTVRRALHRLGYRWKRPQYVLGRPDPDYEAKKGG